MKLRKALAAALVADVVAIAAAMAAAWAARAVHEMQEQAWFWTPPWLEGEQQASADVAAGRVHRSGDSDAFMKDLLNEGPAAHDTAVWTATPA